ncbi:hypothetical protein ACTGJ9_026760 [Bradyrhizobium sp. RDM12]
MRGAFVTFLFAGGSAAATMAWEKHGDTAMQMLAEWTPALTSLLPSTSQTASVAAAQAAPPAAQDQAADQTAATPAAPTVAAAAAPAATQTDATQTVESMTRDIAAMAQQIDQLKTSIAELKAGQEQMVREMAKPPTPRPIAEAKPPGDPRARVSALPPRAPAPTVRKPKPVVSHTYMPTYSPPPIAPPPPPSQAAAVRRRRHHRSRQRKRLPMMTDQWCVRRCRCTRSASNDKASCPTRYDDVSPCNYGDAWIGAKRKGRRDLCRRPSLAAAGSRSPVLLQFHAS